jgi:hypothetical protein
VQCPDVESIEPMATCLGPDRGPSGSRILGVVAWFARVDRVGADICLRHTCRRQRTTTASAHVVRRCSHGLGYL